MFKIFIKYIDLIKTYNPFIFRIIFYELLFLLLMGIKYSKEFKGWENIPTISAPYFFINIINKFVISKKIINIIDIGSGTGKILVFLSKQNKKLKLFGVEVNKEAYDFSIKVSQGHNINFVNTNISQYIFPNSLELFILADPFRGKIFFETIDKILKFSNQNNRTVYIAYINGHHVKDLRNYKNLKVVYKLFHNTGKNPKGIVIYEINK